MKYRKIKAAFDITDPKATFLAVKKLAERDATKAISLLCTKGENKGAMVDKSTNWAEARKTAYAIPLMAFIAARTDLDFEVDHQEVYTATLSMLDFLQRQVNRFGGIELAGAVTGNEVGFGILGMIEIANIIESYDAKLAEKIDSICKKAGLFMLESEALSANHRWAAQAAPAILYFQRYGDERFLKLAENYLADGIDCNEDGCWYFERSTNYNNVANQGMLYIADALKRKDLYKHVVNNGYFSLAMQQNDGSADSSFSHRQDRYKVNCFSMPYNIARRLATITQDGRFSNLALKYWGYFYENNSTYQLGEHPIIDFFKNQGKIPAPIEALDEDIHKYFKASNIVRHRLKNSALTINWDHGKHFYTSVLDQWGGIKGDCSWFHLQHGNIVLENIILTGSSLGNVFFEKGEVNENEVILASDIAGWTHVQHFRKGSPQVPVIWDWKSKAKIVYSENEIDIDINSTAHKRIIAANLVFFIRPNAKVKTAISEFEAKAKEIIDLTNTDFVELSDGKNVMRIEGFKQSKHKLYDHKYDFSGSHLYNKCALHVGMIFPIDCKLKITLS